MSAETHHLRPTAQLAERVLLPGDPGRALLLAQKLLTTPKMFNHRRGLWGYTGAFEDGELLTIQSTGMGGASAAIVIEELVRLGARRLVRVGTCGALAPELALGDLVVAEEAIAADGASRALGAGERTTPDRRLTEAVSAAAAAAESGAHAGCVACTDLFYDPDADRAAGWAVAGALAVEMESATLFRLAALREVRAASILAVSNLVLPGTGRRRLGDEELEAAAERMGAVAARGLAATPSPR